MNKKENAKLKVIEGAKEYGINVVLEDKGDIMKMKFYVEDPSQFEEEYYFANEQDQAVPFEIKKGDFIGEGEATCYDNEGLGNQELNVSEKYLKALPGLDSSEDYVDEDHYFSYYTEEGDIEPISLSYSLVGYYLSLMEGYRGKFWQFIHPDVKQHSMYY